MGSSFRVSHHRAMTVIEDPKLMVVDPQRVYLCKG